MPIELWIDWPGQTQDRQGDLHTALSGCVRLGGELRILKRSDVANLVGLAIGLFRLAHDE